MSVTFFLSLSISAIEFRNSLPSAAWLSCKAWDSQPIRSGFEPYWFHWVFRGSVFRQDTSES